MSRKNLVDGSVAYKDRKFEVAEELFRRAAARDPEGETMEGRTAQLFLARTLHSQFIGNRQDTAKADEAIAEYKKALAVDKNDQSSYKAVASLYDNLQRGDDWQNWVTQRANDTEILPQNRAEALVSLAARKNTCANEISDTDATRKTVKGADGKDEYQYVKPENPADLERLRGCVTEGNSLIDQAVALEPAEVTEAANADVTALTDEQLREMSELVKVFESVRSYDASLAVQAMRLAEMDGRADDSKRFKDESEKAREAFLRLTELGKKFEDEIQRRSAAAAQAANAEEANK